MSTVRRAAFVVMLPKIVAQQSMRQFETLVAAIPEVDSDIRKSILDGWRADAGLLDTAQASEASESDLAGLGIVVTKRQEDGQYR